jgi:hypothetical protein
MTADRAAHEDRPVELELARQPVLLLPLPSPLLTICPSVISTPKARDGDSKLSVAFQ